VLPHTPALDAHGQPQPLAQVGHLAPVGQPRRRQLCLGLAHPPKRPLDPGALLLHERLDVPQREAVRHHDLDPVPVNQDAGAARPVGASDAVGDRGQGEVRV
jgi:hypothetical protein